MEVVQILKALGPCGQHPGLQQCVSRPKQTDQAAGSQTREYAQYHQLWQCIGVRQTLAKMFQ
jgi:hypothetical protein